MKQNLLKTSGLAVIMLLWNLSGYSQDVAPPAPVPPASVNADSKNMQEEIIIKKKNDKDTKVTVEVKDGQVFINGKPLNEFNDDNVVVIKRKTFSPDNQVYVFSGPEMPNSPFRDQSFGPSSKSFNMTFRSNIAFLGVASENTDGKGAKIKDVSKASAAEKAGLKKGDIIIKINEIEIKNPEQLTEAVHQFKPEDIVTVTYKRDGKTQNTSATLGKIQNADNNMNYNFNQEDFSNKLAQLDMLRRNQSFNRDNNDGRFFWGNDDDHPKLGIKAQDLEDGNGAKVLDVDDESPANKAGIKEDDIITQFDGKTVSNVETLAKLASENQDKTSHKINIIRDGKPQEIIVKIPKKLNTADL